VVEQLSREENVTRRTHVRINRDGLVYTNLCQQKEIVNVRMRDN
jgi:hypothetical protein